MHSILHYILLLDYLSALSRWQDRCIQISSWNIFSQVHQTSAKSTRVCLARSWLQVDEETLSGRYDTPEDQTYNAVGSILSVVHSDDVWELSFLSKLLERVVQSRLQAHLDSNDMMPKTVRLPSLPQHRNGTFQSVQRFAACYWWWTGLCSVSTRSDSGIRYCRSRPVAVSAWETVRVAWSSHLVVPILPEWQIVQSFVRVFYVVNGVHRVQCFTGFCLGSEVIHFVYRGPGGCNREAWCDVACVCRRHTTIPALSPWRHGVDRSTTRAMPLWCRPLDVCQ